MAGLIEGPIAAERLLATTGGPACGAVVLFLGTTRDHHQGRRVERLFYEAYRPMALAVLERIEREAAARHDIAACRIVHRLGEVPAGESSVAVVCAAAHRGPAFDAARWAMDELKRSAPIWKKECFADGDSEWVGGTRLE